MKNRKNTLSVKNTGDVSPLEELAHSYALWMPDSNEFAPGLSELDQQGLSVALYSDRQKANSAIESAGGTEETIELQPIAPVWDFIVDAASRGFSSLVIDGQIPIRLFNRLSDIDRSQPSLAGMAASNSVKPETIYFGVRGIVTPKPSSLVRWQDLPRFDRLTVRHALQDGPVSTSLDRFYSCFVGDTPLLFGEGAPLLGPYISDVGAFTVFTGESAARRFLNKYRNSSLKQDWESVVILPIDLAEFLEQTDSQHGPFIDWGLNPGSHRLDQGYFWVKGKRWFLRTISGIFELKEDHTFDRVDEILSPKGWTGESPKDDWYSDGLSAKSVVARPYARMFEGRIAQVGDTDADEILNEELTQPFDPAPADQFISLDTFILKGFNKISGDELSSLFFEDPSESGLLCFPDLLAACRFLCHSILPFDEHLRLHGAATCAGPVLTGSKNAHEEREQSDRLNGAIRAILKESLTQGYQPRQARHVMRLFQEISVSTNITEAGFLGDVLFHGPSPENDLLERETDLAEVFDKLRREVTETISLDDDQLQSANRSLGHTINLLSSESKVVLATAMEMFRSVGKRQAFDYAGISMKLVKVVERELRRRVFEAWRCKVTNEGSVDILEKSSARGDRNAQKALAWLNQLTTIELGPMYYILKEATSTAANPIYISLRSFLTRLPDPDWFLSAEFNHMMDLIRNSYRNGGVHSRVIGYDTCQEAMQNLILGIDPFLKKLLLFSTPVSSPSKLN